MTNTKFRKRALLSSVAMLPVALVALGSATFAWFTANTTVTANGFKAQASTADGLKISKKDIDYSQGAANIADWAQSVTMDDMSGTAWAPVSPVFSGTGATWYSGTAASQSQYNLASAATSGATQYYAKQLWLKSTKSGVSALNVTATITAKTSGQNVAPYVRVALVSAETGNTVVYLGDEANETWHPLADGGAEDSATTLTAVLTSTLDKTNLATGEQFYVYYWLEGQDEDCIDSNAGLDVQVNLTFSI